MNNVSKDIRHSMDPIYNHLYSEVGVYSPKVSVHMFMDVVVAIKYFIQRYRQEA